MTTDSLAKFKPGDKVRVISTEATEKSETTGTSCQKESMVGGRVYRVLYVDRDGDVDVSNGNDESFYFDPADLELVAQ